MSKLLLKELIVLTIIMTLVLTGCGKTIQITDEEEIAEALVESSDNEEDESSDHEPKDEGSLLGNLIGVEDTDDLKEVKWHKNIDNIFPENKDGMCVVCEDVESDGTVWVLYFVDMEDKDVEDYNELLDKKGWEQISSVQMGDVAYYVYTKDGYGITISTGLDENEDMFYGLYLEQDIDREGVIDADTETDSDSVEDIDSDEEESIIYDEQEIPGDFPDHEIPLFDIGILVTGTRMVADDEIIFLLDYLCDEDFDDISEEVIEAFNKEFESGLSIMELGEMTMITGESENHTFNVTIAKTGKKDYPVNLSYQVMGIK